MPSSAVRRRLQQHVEIALEAQPSASGRSDAARNASLARCAIGARVTPSARRAPPCPAARPRTDLLHQPRIERRPRRQALAEQQHRQCAPCRRSAAGAASRRATDGAVVELREAEARRARRDAQVARESEPVERLAFGESDHRDAQIRDRGDSVRHAVGPRPWRHGRTRAARAGRPPHVVVEIDRAAAASASAACSSRHEPERHRRAASVVTPRACAISRAPGDSGAACADLSPAPAARAALCAGS